MVIGIGLVCCLLVSVAWHFWADLPIVSGGCIILVLGLSHLIGKIGKAPGSSSICFVACLAIGSISRPLVTQTGRVDSYPEIPVSVGLLALVMTVLLVAVGGARRGRE